MPGTEGVGPALPATCEYRSSRKCGRSSVHRSNEERHRASINTRYSQGMASIQVADERALLDGMVDLQRAEIAGILEDISEAEARARLVPSLTTPLSLVKHATFVERIWFHSRVAGVSRAELGLPDTVDESFVLEPTDTVASVRQAFLDACDHSRSVAAAHDLDEQFPWHQGPVSLRFIYAHIIRELARHAGHGDILVEQLRAKRESAS